MHLCTARPVNVTAAFLAEYIVGKHWPLIYLFFRNHLHWYGKENQANYRKSNRKIVTHFYSWSLEWLSSGTRIQKWSSHLQNSYSKRVNSNMKVSVMHGYTTHKSKEVWFMVVFLNAKMKDEERRFYLGPSSPQKILKQSQLAAPGRLMELISYHIIGQSPPPGVKKFFRDFLGLNDERKSLGCSFPNFLSKQSAPIVRETRRWRRRWRSSSQIIYRISEYSHIELLSKR